MAVYSAASQIFLFFFFQLGFYLISVRKGKEAKREELNAPAQSTAFTGVKGSIP